MPIKFRCSSCGKPLSIARRKVGTSVTCLGCSTALTVPAESDSSLDALRPQRGDSDSTDLQPAPVEAEPFPTPPANSPSPVEVPVALATADNPCEPPPSDGGHRRAVALVALLLLLLLSGGGALLLFVLDRREAPGELAEGTSAPPPGRQPLLIDRMPGPDGKRPGVNPLIDPLAPKVSPPPSEPAPKEETPPPLAPAPKPPPEKKLPPAPPAESEDGLYRLALKTATEALDGERFEQAITWFRIAGKLRNTDEVIQGLQRAEQGRLAAIALAEATKKRLEQEKRLGLYDRSMVTGQSARSLQEFDRAIKAFTEALNLFPDDVHAAEALALTRKERDRAAERARLASDRQQEAKARREAAEYRQALKAGWAAMRDGQFGAAKQSFHEALTLRPEDDEAKDGWERARHSLAVKKWQDEQREEEQWRRRREELARQEREERTKAFDKFMLEGREALASRRPAEAVGLVAQALEMRPDDAAALGLRDEAVQARDKLLADRERLEKERAEIQARAATAAARKLEKLQLEQVALKESQAKQRQTAERRQFLIDSQVALAGGRFDEALTLLDRVRTGSGDSPVALALRQEATKRKADREASRQQFKELVAAKEQAREEEARRKLEKQQRLLEEQTAKAETARRATAFQRLQSEGKSALDRFAFDEAADQFRAALRVRPDDAAVTGLLEKALREREAHRKAAAAEKEKQDRELALAAEEARRKKEAVQKLEAERQAREQAARKARDFDRFLLDGRVALGKGQVEAALAQFAKADKLQPGDRGLATLMEQTRRQQEKQRAAKTEEEKYLAREQARREEQRRLAQAKRDLQEKERRAEQTARQKAEDYKTAMKHGREALAQDKPLVAIAAFREALQARPGDAEADAGLRQAQQANERRLADAGRKAAEQERQWQERLAQEKAKRLAREYDEFMIYGREALKKGRPEAAVGAFSEALQRTPGAAAADAGLAQARELLARANAEAAREAEERRERLRAAEAAQQKALAEARAKAAARQVKVAPPDELRLLLATGRAAVELRRLDAAAVALAAAQKMAPQDLAVVRLGEGLELARKIVAADKETAKKLALQESLKTFPLGASEQDDLRRAKVALRLEAGQRHLREGRRAEAADEFEAVLRLAPSQPDAVAGLKKSRRTD